MNYLPPLTSYKFRLKRTACPSCGAGRRWSGQWAQYGLSCEPIDLFPERSDGWGIANQIVSELRTNAENFTNKAQIKPVDARKPKNNTNGQLAQENAPQTNLEAKNGEP